MSFRNEARFVAAPLGIASNSAYSEEKFLNR